jgi:triphosphatase
VRCVRAPGAVRHPGGAFCYTETHVPTRTFMKIPASAPEPAAADAAGDFTHAGATALTRPEYPLDATTTAHDVAMAELRRLLALWLRHEPGARLGEDPEELHQLRVAARRIDATLGLFKRQLPAALLRARKTTKAVLRSLGAARDVDVQLAELARYCANLPEQERAAAEPLRVYLESERSRARARMVRALDSEPTRRWLDTLMQAAAESADMNGADPALVIMPERVQRRFRKLRKSVGRLRSKSSMEDYHQVRRRAKQLRYATECGAGLFGKPADDLLKALRRLQDRLGAHQDSYMAQNRLAALAGDPASGLPPATLFLMGRLAEQHARVNAQVRETLIRSWRKVCGRRWRVLRARLGQLSDSASTPSHAPAGQLDAAVAIAASDLTPAGRVPEPESRPVNH